MGSECEHHRHADDSDYGTKAAQRLYRPVHAGRPALDASVNLPNVIPLQLAFCLQGPPPGSQGRKT